MRTDTMNKVGNKVTVITNGMPHRFEANQTGNQVEAVNKQVKFREMFVDKDNNIVVVVSNAKKVWQDNASKVVFVR